MYKFKLTTMILLGLSYSVFSADFCVSNETELRSALATAESNSSFDHIKIMEGNYETNGTRFNFDDISGYGLEISGGWGNAFGNSCSSQLNQDVFSTVLDGSLSSAILRIKLSNSASLRISRVTFMNSLSGSTAVNIFKGFSSDVYTGEYTLERNAFINNESDDVSALYINGADTMIFRNNLFSNNIASIGNTFKIANGLGVKIYFTNNTITSNNEHGSIDLDGSSQLLVANNVFYDNGSTDLWVFGSGTTYSYNNNIKRLLTSSAGTLNEYNFNLNPQFVNPEMLDYSPGVASPLIDKGFLSCLDTPFFCIFPIPFEQDWQASSIDLMGNSRIQNSKVEIGAIEVSYESDLIYANRFE